MPDAASLRPLFEPRAVAVVGASRSPGNIGHRVLAAPLDAHFQGPVYPVNPRASVVRCLRAYPSVRALPEPVDLAIVCAPRDSVADVVGDCAAAGVKALVVITAGFAEIGSAGERLQAELLAAVRGANMRMVGPNCFGLLNTAKAFQLNATFAPINPPGGTVSMASQSGALGLAILATARHRGVGIAQFVSVGNQADVTSTDLLEYWENAPGTEVILLYVESFGDPRRFARIARRVSRRKPIVALKSGRSGAGARAAGSHTAALAASDVAVEALCRQTGIIRAERLEEMFDLAAALSTQPLPRGRRVGIITNAGGPAILAADACEAAGLVLPELSPAVQQQVAEYLPPTASVCNPIDMIASADANQYRRTVEAVLRSGEVDALIVICIPIGFSDLCEVASAVEAARTAATDAPPMPLCAIWMTEDAEPPGPSGQPIPVFHYPEAAAQVLGRLADYAEWRGQPVGSAAPVAALDAAAVQAICDRSVAETGGGWLSAVATRRLLAAAGFSLLPGGIALDADQAVALAEEVGYPVAIKLASRIILHKTEVGGVQLNLSGPEPVRTAFRKIAQELHDRGQAEALEGVIVQPMMSSGVELMVGMTHDRLFGPLIAFGLGGIHVEILKDVCFRITPLTEPDVQAMVRGIKGYRLLEGYRGHPSADVPAVTALLLRLSQLVEAVPAIEEVDFNPVMALPPGHGCRIIDARIRVAAR